MSQWRAIIAAFLTLPYSVHVDTGHWNQYFKEENGN